MTAYPNNAQQNSLKAILDLIQADQHAPSTILLKAAEAQIQALQIQIAAAEREIEVLQQRYAAEKGMAAALQMEIKALKGN